MSRLTEAVGALGIEGKFALSGRWVEIRGERCAVYVVEAPWNDGFYSWCSDPLEATVEFYSHAKEAIEAGLQRARKPVSG